MKSSRGETPWRFGLRSICQAPCRCERRPTPAAPSRERHAAVRHRFVGLVFSTADCDSHRPTNSTLIMWLWECRVELIVMMFSRLVRREQELRTLLRCLDRETAVLTCQRLGYGVVFDALSPTLFYRLRMWRADEYQVRLQRVCPPGELHCTRALARALCRARRTSATPASTSRMFKL